MLSKWTQDVQHLMYQLQWKSFPETLRRPLGGKLHLTTSICGNVTFWSAMLSRPALWELSTISEGQQFLWYHHWARKPAIQLKILRPNLPLCFCAFSSLAAVPSLGTGTLSSAWLLLLGTHFHFQGNSRKLHGVFEEMSHGVNLQHVFVPCVLGGNTLLRDSECWVQACQSDSTCTWISPCKPLCA